MSRNSTESSVLIEVKNLKSGYADRQVLHNINLSVNNGEILVIMGGSGSGKSTLLRNIDRKSVV